MCYRCRHPFFLLWIFFLYSADLQAKQYVAENWEVQAAVQNDGSLWVTENIRFRFQDGSFSEVFRELPKDYSDGIVDISAAMDGTSMPTESQEKRLEISGRKDIRILWRFPPLSDSVHLFTLKYRILGAMRRDSGEDVLRWNALPRRHDFVIGKASITIVFPAGAEPTKEPEILSGKAEVKRDHHSVQFLAAEIQPNQGLQILLPFRSNSVIAGPPSWQRQEEKHRQTAPYFLGMALTLLSGGVLALFLYHRHYRPQMDRPALDSEPVKRPPEALSPATAGVLISSGARLQWPQVLAAMADLARRGFLQIQESEAHGWHKHGEFLLCRQEKPDSDLLPHERTILTVLCQTETDTTAPGIRLSQAWKCALGSWKKIDTAMKEELRSAGMFSPERERAGQILKYIALGIGVITVLLFLAAYFLRLEYGAWPLLVPVGTLLVAFGGAILASLWSPLAPHAEVRALQWKKFASHLAEISVGKADAGSPSLFEEYFPYSVSFGLGSEWVEHFRNRGDIILPAWFRALHSGAKAERAFGHWIHAALAAGGSRSIGGGVGRGAGGAAGGGSCGAR